MSEIIDPTKPAGLQPKPNDNTNYVVGENPDSPSLGDTLWEWLKKHLFSGGSSGGAASSSGGGWPPGKKGAQYQDPPGWNGSAEQRALMKAPPVPMEDRTETGTADSVYADTQEKLTNASKQFQDAYTKFTNAETDAAKDKARTKLSRAVHDHADAVLDAIDTHTDQSSNGVAPANQGAPPPLAMGGKVRVVVGRIPPSGKNKPESLFDAKR